MTIETTKQNEWPKEWSKITEDTDNLSFHTQYIEYQEGMRGYKGTLYVSIDVGKDTHENRDLWFPFEMYIVHIASKEI